MVNINKVPNDITNTLTKKLNELMKRYDNPLYNVDLFLFAPYIF